MEGAEELHQLSQAALPGDRVATGLSQTGDKGEG